MEMSLTAGAITKMMNGEVTSEKDMTPVLQVTELKLIQNPNPNPEAYKDRYKLVLSDGVLSQQGMLNTPLNGLVEEGTLQLGSIIRLAQYVCNRIQNRRFVMVVNLEIIAVKWDIIRIPGQVGKPNEPGQQHGGFEQQQSRKSELNGLSADLSQLQLGAHNNPTIANKPELKKKSKPLGFIFFQCFSFVLFSPFNNKTIK